MRVRAPRLTYANVTATLALILALGGTTYAATLTEGSASDLDAGASAYGSPLNGLNQGSDNTSRFRFTLPLPGGVAVGTRLTATATIAATGTSEFSGAVTVTTGVSVSGFVYADADHDAQKDAGESGTGLALWAKLVAASATAASQVVAVTPVTGAFAFTFVAGGSWTVVLDDSNDPADITPGVPDELMFTPETCERLPHYAGGKNGIRQDVNGPPHPAPGSPAPARRRARH